MEVSFFGSTQCANKVINGKSRFLKSYFDAVLSFFRVILLLLKFEFESNDALGLLNYVLYCS